MPIATHCPQCRAEFNLPDSLAGKNAKCARCQTVFPVPALDDAPLASLADDPPVGRGLAAAPAPPRRYGPRHDEDYPRERDARPRRSGSGVGWIVALAVGVPLLLLSLIGCGIGGLMMLAFYTAPKPATFTVGPNAPGGPAPMQPNVGVFPPPAPDPGGPPPQKPRDLPPPLKPPAPVEVTPAALAQDKVVKPLPATVADAAVGGGGRFLILYLPQQNKLAIFDVSAAKVVKYLSFDEPSLKFAAGMDKLIVALPASRVLRRYSLQTFEEEQTAPLPIDGDLEALCMGSASNGPLWVQGLGDKHFTDMAVLVDPSTLKEWPADWGGDDKRQPNGQFLRASEDGQVFVLREGGGEPHTETVVAVRGGRPQVNTQWGVSSSIVVPDADGRTLYAGDAVYNADLKPIFPNPPPNMFAKPFLPAVHGPYFVRLDYKDWGQAGGDLSFFLAGTQEPFASLKNLESVTSEFSAGKLAYDRRTFVIPAARVVVAIPPTDDRLILYRFDPEAARR